jgi:hypothetical protein
MHPFREIASAQSLLAMTKNNNNSQQKTTNTSSSPCGRGVSRSDGVVARNTGMHPFREFTSSQSLLAMTKNNNNSQQKTTNTSSSPYQGEVSPNGDGEVPLTLCRQQIATTPK